MQCKFAWLTSEETFFKLLHQPKTWGGWVAPVWQLCLLDTYWDSMKQGVLSTTDLACVNHLFAGPQAIKGREEFKIPIRSHRMWCKALKATKTQPWLSRVPRDFSPTWAIMPFSCQKNGLAKLHDEIARIHENAGTVTHSPALRCSAHVSTCGTSNCLKTLSWLVNYSSQSNHQLLTLKYTWFPMNPQITWRNASILHLSNKKSEDFFPHSFPVSSSKWRMACRATEPFTLRRSLTTEGVISLAYTCGQGRALFGGHLGHLGHWKLHLGNLLQHLVVGCLVG